MEWMENLNRTRSIILLDTCRKIYTFFINKQMVHKLVNKIILTGINWTRLPKG